MASWDERFGDLLLRWSKRSREKQAVTEIQNRHGSRLASHRFKCAIADGAGRFEDVIPGMGGSCKLNCLLGMVQVVIHRAFQSRPYLN